MLFDLSAMDSLGTFDQAEAEEPAVVEDATKRESPRQSHHSACRAEEQPQEIQEDVCYKLAEIWARMATKICFDQGISKSVLSKSELMLLKKSLENIDWPLSLG